MKHSQPNAPRFDAFYFMNASVALLFGSFSLVAIASASSLPALLQLLTIGGVVRLVCLNFVGAAVVVIMRLATSRRRAAPALSLLVQVGLALMAFYEASRSVSGISNLPSELWKLGIFFGANLILIAAAIFSLTHE